MNPFHFTDQVVCLLRLRDGGVLSRKGDRLGEFKPSLLFEIV